MQLQNLLVRIVLGAVVNEQKLKFGFFDLLKNAANLVVKRLHVGFFVVARNY